MKKHSICSKKEMVLCQETSLIRTKKGLRPVDGCAILIIEKGKPEKRPTLSSFELTLYSASRQLFAVVGGYFRLSLKIS